MSDIRLLRPAAGTNQSVACEPEANFIFEFPTDAATLSRSGDDLVMTFEDGATLSLTDFYKTYSSENMPSFDVDGAQVAGADFFTAMNEPDLMPAAGPGGNNAPGGGRYHEYANMALYDGLDRLGGLDVGWPDGGYEPEIDGGLGLRGAGDEEDTQNGIPTITPTDPNRPWDPDTPVFPPNTPGNPNEPSTPGGNTNPSAGRDVLTVHEKHLSKGTAPDESSLTVQGSMQVESPDGVDRLEVGGKTVYENGEFIPGQTIETDEGTLTVTDFNPETGELTYEYTLEDPSQKHDKTQNPDADDKFGYDIPVTVTDPDGDSASSTITVVIEDDAPDAKDDDAGTATEGGTVELSGNVLDGTVGSTTDPGAADQFGADGPQGGKGTVEWHVPADWQPVVGQENTYHTKYGDITLHEDGNYEFKLADPKSEEMLELKGGRADLKVGYSITDADGDTDSAELTLHVQGVNHEVTIEDGPEDNPGGGDGVVDNGVSHVIVYESGLSNGGTHADEETAPTNAKNSFTVKAEDGLKELTVGRKTVWSSEGKSTVTEITDDYGNTLHITGVTDNGDGTYTVTYDYTLKGATDKHDKDNHDASLDSSFDVVVTDADDDTAKGTITATVVDDTPTAINDHVTLGEGESVSGSVLSGTADVKDKEGKLKDDNPVDTDGDTASGDSFGADGEGTFDRQEDGPKVRWDVERFKATEDEQGNIIVDVEGIGTATLRPNGTYDFTASKDGLLEYNEEFPLTFDYTITDKDGDTSQASLTITIEGNSTPDIPEDPDDPYPDHEHEEAIGVKADSIIVDEALMSNGTGAEAAGGYGDGHAASSQGGFVVDLHGEGGDITLQHGDDSVTLHVDEDGTCTFRKKDGNVLNSDDGLTVNGVKVNDFNAEVGTDGKVHVTYTYTLEESQNTHTVDGEAPDSVGAADSLDDKITVHVVDGHGQDTADGYIDVQVHDDGPKVTVTPDTGTEGTPLSGTLDMNFGADGMAAMPEGWLTGNVNWDALTVKVGDQVYYGHPDGCGNIAFQVPGGTITIDGKGKPEFDGDTYRYTFTPDSSNKSGTLDFTFVVKDGDGDTARQNVHLEWSTPTPEILGLPGSLATDDSYVAEQKDQSETVVTQPAGTRLSPVEGGDNQASSATTAPRTFTVVTNGQACTLQISGGEGGDTLTVNFDENGDVSSYSLGNGTLTQWPEEGVTVHGQYGDLTIKVKKGEVTYTYTQTKNYEHTHDEGQGGGSPDELRAAESFGVTLNGDDGKQAYNGSIHVSIEDDEPIVDQHLDFARDTTFSPQEDQAAVYNQDTDQPNAHDGTVTLTGKVHDLNFGADGAKSVDIVMDGRTFHGDLGTDGQWKWTDEKGGSLQDGTVTFEQEGDTGTFTVTLPASEIEKFSQTDAEGKKEDEDGNPIDDHTIDFTVRVTDGDGDTAEACGQLKPPVADDDRTDVDMADFNVRVEIGDTLVHVKGKATIGDGEVDAHSSAGGAQFRDGSHVLMKAKEFTGGNKFQEVDGTPSEYEGEIYQGEENENFFGRFFKDGNGNALTMEQLFSEHSANVYDFNIDEYIGEGKHNSDLLDALQEAAKYARENGQILHVYSENDRTLELDTSLDFSDGDNNNETHTPDLIVVVECDIELKGDKSTDNDLIIDGFLYVAGNVTVADDIKVSGGMAVEGDLKYNNKLDARWYADDGLLMSKNMGITVTFGELLENDYDLDSTHENVRDPWNSEQPHINREGLHILEGSIQLDPECEKDWTLEVNPEKGTVTVTPKPGCEPQTPPKFHYTVEDEHGLRDDASFDFDVYTLVEGHGGRLENPVEATDFHDIVVANSDGDPYVDYQPKSYNIGIVLDASSSMRPSGDLTGRGQIHFEFVENDMRGNLGAENLEDMFGSWNRAENSGTTGQITVKLGDTVLYWDGITNHDSGTGTQDNKGEYNDAGNRLDFYEAYDENGNGIGDKVSLYDDDNDGTYDRWRVYPSEKDDRASVTDEHLVITDKKTSQNILDESVSWHSRAAVLREALEGLLKQLGSYEGEITLYVSQFNNNHPTNEITRENIIWSGTREKLAEMIEWILEQYETHSGTFYDEGFTDVFESFFGKPEKLNPDQNAENHLYFLTDGSPNDQHEGVKELEKWWDEHGGSVHLHMVGIGNDLEKNDFDDYQKYADDVIIVSDEGDLNAALEELTESIIDFIPSMDVVDAGDGNDIVFGDAVGDLYAKLDYLVNENEPNDERIPEKELKRLEDLRNGLLKDDLNDWVDKVAEAGGWNAVLAAQFIAEHPDLFDQSYETFIVDNEHYAYDKGDVLFGGEGNDLIYGQGGNDILFGDGTFGTPDEDGNRDYGTLGNLAQLLGQDSTAENNVEELVGKLNADGEYKEDSSDSVTSHLDKDGLKDLAGKLEKNEADGGIERETDGNDLLFGGSGDDLLLGGGGNDYLDGGEGKDSIFGGSGNDLIVYDSDDFAVFGGSGIDILLSNTANTTTLESLLNNDGDQPHVNSVEVFLKDDGTIKAETRGFNVEDLTSLSDLAEKAGITVDGDTLTFDKTRGWSVDATTLTASNDELGLAVDLSSSMTVTSETETNVFLLNTSQGA